jgi:hypothetical protein
MSTCTDLIDSADKGGMFHFWIITGDETWCFLYDLQLKQQLASGKWPSLRRKKKQHQDGPKGKCPEVWHRKNWLLLCNNAPAHRAVHVQEEMAGQQATILPHPPYSPHLAPCDFFFLPHFIERLCGCQFQLVKEFVPATKDFLVDIFQHCFQQLYQH